MYLLYEKLNLKNQEYFSVLTYYLKLINIKFEKINISNFKFYKLKTDYFFHFKQKQKILEYARLKK